MSERRRAQVIAALKSKSFEVRQGGHTKFFLLVDGGKTPINTFISHSDRKVDSARLRQLATELRLDVKELLDLIDCPLSGEAYVALLKQRGVL